MRIDIQLELLPLEPMMSFAVDDNDEAATILATFAANQKV